MSAKASGSDAQSNGDAKHRNHNDGSETRSYTPEQKAEVIRIRKCTATSFYEILAVEKTASDGQIKKAYRKISLLTHPDKNGYSGADEAFKMVSRAFQILSDPDKKAKYDRFGGDPDSRFGSGGGGGGGAPSASPFGGGFGRSAGAGQNFYYEDEISPEELFNRFFGGGGGMGGFGPFGMNQGFVFNMGGGPGFRVHQMGGGMPRRRPPGSGQAEAPEGLAALKQLLPILLIFILPLLSQLFSAAGGSSGPGIRFDAPHKPYTMHRQTPEYKVDYFVNPKEVDGYTEKKLRQLDRKAEVEYISTLNYQCEHERNVKHQAINDATGFFFTDENALRAARAMPMVACERIDELRKTRS